MTPSPSTTIVAGYRAAVSAGLPSVRSGHYPDARGSGRAGSERPLFLIVVCLLAGITAAPQPTVGDERSEFFEKQVRPLLIQKCAECHSGTTPEGDLRVDSLASLQAGGVSGPAVVPGQPESGLLAERITADDPDLQMPPKQRLSTQEIHVLKRWIAEGAVWPESDPAWTSDESRASHWAFQPIGDVRPPDVVNREWCRTPIDQFIAAGHAARGLKPVAAADRPTLIRRATLDLTGLPPRIEDVDAFVADQSPDAFSAVIERLLEDPGYGERWGRHWLDQARYADTSGDGTDTPIPEARYYRDYVIRSLNEDLPWNEFLIEQIAGDILARQEPQHPRANDRIIATGYIALSRRFGNSAFYEMNLIIDDTIDTIGKSTLGLTLGCARCHHHKFDPVTLNDYYGLYGYFENTQYPHAGTEHQKDRSHFVSLQKNDTWRSDYESLEAWAVAESDQQTGDTAIRIGGDISQKGDVVPRGFLSAVSTALPEIPKNSSGRLQLARWIGSDSNPLSPRVIVNRVWQYHFGRGIVESSSNFGLQGSRPTHPELLDWLTADFVRHGWSLKHLHRRIMLSSVYQLSSEGDTASMAADESNQGYWRFDRRRMDAETLRDSLLAVSGQLQPGDPGRHPFKPTDKLKYSQGNPFNEVFDHNHRSVYLMTARLNKHPFMSLFDGPDPNKSTENRRESTVALQALYLMNSPLMKQTAAAFAGRIMNVASDPQQRIQYAWYVTCGRPPRDEEVSDCMAAVADIQSTLQQSGRPPAETESLAWASLARTLLSSNEFLYID